MNNKVKGLAVSVLTVLGVTFAGGAAMAAESPTFFAKVGTTDVTVFSETSSPVVISTEDVVTDDSTGCVIRFDHPGNVAYAGEHSSVLTNVGGTDAAFSAYTETLTWDATTFGTRDGEKISYAFWADVACPTEGDIEAAIDGLGAATADISVTIEATTEETTDPTVAAPGAPATVTVGDINATNAKVTWTAPTTGDAVTSYVVLVGTTNVGTFGPTVLTATLTGLEPNKDYTVTVKAVNAGGEGTKTATFKTADATKSGKVELAAKTGETIAGTKATITATGLKPGADYTIVLRSDPVTLASGKVADNGNLTQEVTLPTIAEGSHSITLTSTYWDGTALSSVIYFTIDADGKLTEITTTAPELAETGLNLILPIGLALALAAGGAAFVVNGIRRRATVTM